jgi:hypothetical protein
MARIRPTVIVREKNLPSVCQFMTVFRSCSACSGHRPVTTQGCVRGCAPFDGSAAKSGSIEAVPPHLASRVGITGVYAAAARPDLWKFT